MRYWVVVNGSPVGGPFFTFEAAQDWATETLTGDDAVDYQIDVVEVIF